MGEKPGLRPDHKVGTALQAVARDILAEARTVIDDPSRSDAEAVHDFRKAMKRWRALLRLLEVFIGADAQRLRHTARDLARELAGARDAQSALDALKDVHDGESTLSERSLKTIRGRIEAIRTTAEVTTLDGTMRTKLMAAMDEASAKVEGWTLDDVAFGGVAAALTDTYRRARRLMPADWKRAEPAELHELRQRSVEHRYQMELVEPLWPKLGKLWVDEAQRLRDRLGAYQNLVLLLALTAPHQPLAHWRSRLVPLIEARQAKHVRAAHRIAGRLFAESPKAFRRRLETLWDVGS